MLRELREAQGLSQAAVAERTGVMEQPQISAYERGVFTPTPDRLRLLASALGVPYVRLAAAAGYADEPETLGDAERSTTERIAADLFAFAARRPDLLATLIRLRESNDDAAYARALAVIHRFLIAAAEQVRDDAEARK